MEDKSVLFKEFGSVEAILIGVGIKAQKKLLKVKYISPAFGGKI